MPFPYNSLRHFIEALEAEGELVRISEEVDTELEITDLLGWRAAGVSQ